MDQSSQTELQPLLDGIMGWLPTTTMGSLPLGVMDLVIMDHLQRFLRTIS